MLQVYLKRRAIYVLHYFSLFMLLLVLTPGASVIGTVNAQPKVQESEISSEAERLAELHGLDPHLVQDMLEHGIPAESIDPATADAYLTEQVDQAADNPPNLSPVVPSEESWQQYTDNQFQLSFEYPAFWSVSNLDSHEAEYVHELMVYGPALARILISRFDNPEQLSPQQWFQQNRSKYHEFVVEVGELSIQGHPTLIVGQPATCQTYPFLAAFIAYDHYMLVVHHSELASRSSAPELGRLLETLSFDQQRTAARVPSAYLQIPAPPENVSCSQ